MLEQYLPPCASIENWCKNRGSGLTLRTLDYCCKIRIALTILSQRDGLISTFIRPPTFLSRLTGTPT